MRKSLEFLLSFVMEEERSFWQSTLSLVLVTVGVKVEESAYRNCHLLGPTLAR
jgi:hypothetical protein